MTVQVVDTMVGKRSVRLAILCIFLCVWGHAGESDTTASLEVRLQPPAGGDEFWREGKALGKIRCAVVEERDDDIVKYATIPRDENGSAYAVPSERNCIPDSA